MQYSNQSNNNFKIKCLCDRRIQNSRTLEDVEFFEKFSQRLSGVNYFCKKLDLRWLIGLWIRLCAVLLTLKLSSTSYSAGKHLFILRNKDIRVISINNARMSLLSAFNQYVPAEHDVTVIPHMTRLWVCEPNSKRKIENKKG